MKDLIGRVLANHLVIQLTSIKCCSLIDGRPSKVGLVTESWIGPKFLVVFTNQKNSGKVTGWRASWPGSKLLKCVIAVIVLFFILVDTFVDSVVG